MRVLLPVVLVISVGAGIVAGSLDQGRDAGPTLAAAREALGGDQALSAVKSFVATGRTRQIRGNNLVPIEFEVACELPSKYVRRDEVPAQESEPTTSGFNGDALIQFPRPAEPPPARRQARGQPQSKTPTAPAGGSAAPAHGAGARPSRCARFSRSAAGRRPIPARRAWPRSSRTS